MISGKYQQQINMNKINTFSHMQTKCHINPMVIEEKSSFATTYDIFSRLLSDRVIFLGEEINDETANVIQAQLLYLDFQNNDDIFLYINTPGGSVSAGLAIYDTMNYIKSNVNTICTGLAASMGSILLCSGTKGKRYALPHSKIMIHQPSGVAYGPASDILIEAKEIENIRTELYNILSSKTGQSFEKIATDADRNYWMTSEEALKYGIIDKIK